MDSAEVRRLAWPGTSPRRSPEPFEIGLGPYIAALLVGVNRLEQRNQPPSS